MHARSEPAETKDGRSGPSTPPPYFGRKTILLSAGFAPNGAVRTTNNNDHTYARIYEIVDDGVRNNRAPPPHFSSRRWLYFCFVWSRCVRCCRARAHTHLALSLARVRSPRRFLPLSIGRRDGIFEGRLSTAIVRPLTHTYPVSVVRYDAEGRPI